MIASLPMYDFPGLESHTDALWDAVGGRLRSAGIDAPRRLTRHRPLEDIWTDPNLLLGQTCGYPLVKRLAGQVRVVATPHYTAKGCDGSRHCSVIVARTDDPRGGLDRFRWARCAVNDEESNTGMNLLRAEIAHLAHQTSDTFFSEVLLTGSHAASIDAVIDGAADIAAIDCVTYALQQRLRPVALTRIRAVALTARTPSLPLIASRSTQPETIQTLRNALFAAADDVALKPTLDALLLTRFSRLPPTDYEAVLSTEQAAVTLGYARLQ